MVKARRHGEVRESDGHFFDGQKWRPPQKGDVRSDGFTFLGNLWRGKGTIRSGPPGLSGQKKGSWLRLKRRLKWRSVVAAGKGLHARAKEFVRQWPFVDPLVSKQRMSSARKVAVWSFWRIWMAIKAKKLVVVDAERGKCGRYDFQKAWLLSIYHKTASFCAKTDRVSKRFVGKRHLQEFLDTLRRWNRRGYTIVGHGNDCRHFGQLNGIQILNGHLALGAVLPTCRPSDNGSLSLSILGPALGVCGERTLQHDEMDPYVTAQVYEAILHAMEKSGVKPPKTIGRMPRA